MSDPDDLLKKLEELRKQTKATRMRYVDEYTPLQGEPAISAELKNAVSTLVKTKYRGANRWKVVVAYRFTEEGVKVRTSVRDDGGSFPIEFTEAEAIAIAQNVASKQQEQEGA